MLKGASHNLPLIALLLMLFQTSRATANFSIITSMQGDYDSLTSDAFIDVNGGLINFFYRVRSDKRATIAFLGGSITAGAGWRDMVMDYLKSEYPETAFTFINAGIPSLGSLPHAFRLQADVMSKGRIDLLFVESAVNDRGNGTPMVNQRRALEGIVRHAKEVNPAIDIVLMAFADEQKIADYDAGSVPAEVEVHRDVAQHYNLPFINLAREVAERIRSKEFTWKDDFKDLHPSLFGHRLYFQSMKRLIELASEKKIPSRLITPSLPAPLDKHHYARGVYISVDEATKLRGFVVDPSWEPDDAASTRSGFVAVPMLVSDTPGSSFELSFNGTAVGLAVVSGPDAGIIRYSIDDGEEKTMDLFTRWSTSLHLPWYVLLGDGLKKEKHTLRVTLLETHPERSNRSACRVVHFLVNR